MPKTIYRVEPDEPDGSAAPSPEPPPADAIPPETATANDVQDQPSKPSVVRSSQRWIVLTLVGIAILVIIMIIVIVVLGATEDTAAALSLLG